MNWNQLQYVITVAEEKNITKAAKKLFISQPSLSLSIQSLERETGVALFERTNDGLCLTYAGSLFYEWAAHTLRSQNQLHSKLNDISNEKRHLIRIGLSAHRTRIMLPCILEQFYSEYPQCEIHIAEKPTYILKCLLEERQIDFMIDVPHPDNVNYKSELLTEERIVLAVPKSFCNDAVFKNNGLASVSLSDLEAYPFIMLSPDQVLGSMSRKMCESASFSPDIRLICENVETALAMVSRRLGITFVPEILVKQQNLYTEVSYFAIRQFHEGRKLCLVYHQNSYQPAPLLRLIELFRENIARIYMA